MESLSAELRERFAAIVGASYLCLDATSLDSFTRTTLPQGTKPIGVVRPESRLQVQELLRLASQAHTPIYALSTGKNWGYGDACAPESGCVILDLSRMNRIIEVNAEMAYAVIEPGVTQGAMAAYLAENHLPLTMDCTGAGPEAGFLGNTLERGFGHSSYGDRFAHSCNYEVVLADGTLLYTGFGGYPNAAAQHLYKWGIGPALDGMFTQSNFGVVTRMTVWLMPKKARTDYYFIGLNRPEAMAELAERLRPLFLAGTLRNILHCSNDFRLLASYMQFPWNEADGKTSLDIARPDIINNSFQAFNILSWSCAGVLTGSKEEVKAQRSQLRKHLKNFPGLEKFFVLDDRTYEWGKQIICRLPSWAVFNKLRRDLEKVRWIIELLRGHPSYQFLSSAHWRARISPGTTQDPLETRAGLIWLAPVLPARATAVVEVNRLGQTTFHKFGFEYQVTFSFSTERSLSAIMSISFDRTSAEETERARQCHDQLVWTLLSKGYIPYRAAPLTQALIWKIAPDSWQALSRLQKAWDPHGVISPGHYIPK